MPASVAYDAVAQELGTRASTVHPSEAHGCLCGALCARRRHSPREWLEEILTDVADAGDAGALGQLYDWSSAALDGSDLEFEPLLPEDDVALASRVEALAAWCTGFLYGFGAAAGPNDRHPLPSGVSEVLADLARIAQAGAPGPDPGEEDEGAYAELVEYLRAAVQLVYEELQPPVAAPRASRPAY